MPTTIAKHACRSSRRSRRPSQLSRCTSGFTLEVEAPIWTESAYLYQPSLSMTDDCPVAQTDGHDLPGLFEEGVPRFAAEHEDVVVALEDAIGEPVLAHELPDVLGRIEFWGPRRER